MKFDFCPARQLPWLCKFLEIFTMTLLDKALASKMEGISVSLINLKLSSYILSYPLWLAITVQLSDCSVIGRMASGL